MEFLKKYWWVLLLILVAIFFFIGRAKKKAEQDKIPTQTVQQVEAPRPLTLVGNQPSVTTPTPVTSQTIGTTAAGTTLTRSQCKATCKGKCGPRCPWPTKRCRSVKQCWANCKSTYCNYIVGDIDND